MREGRGGDTPYGAELVATPVELGHRARGPPTRHATPRNTTPRPYTPPAPLSGRYGPP